MRIPDWSSPPTPLRKAWILSFCPLIRTRVHLAPRQGWALRLVFWQPARGILLEHGFRAGKLDQETRSAELVALCRTGHELGYHQESIPCGWVSEKAYRAIHTRR